MIKLDEKKFNQPTNKSVNIIKNISNNMESNCPSSITEHTTRKMH